MPVLTTFPLFLFLFVVFSNTVLFTNLHFKITPKAVTLVSHQSQTCSFIYCLFSGYLCLFWHLIHMMQFSSWKIFFKVLCKLTSSQFYVIKMYVNIYNLLQCDICDISTYTIMYYININSICCFPFLIPPFPTLIGQDIFQVLQRLYLSFIHSFIYTYIPQMFVESQLCATKCTKQKGYKYK